MNAEKYTYDVAFSFLAQDEPIATSLNDLLQDRFKTFIYSENQREIAGTDGEETFSLVFGEQARLVVVLYRKGWGETPWTRIEETAIRKRGFNNGYGFLHLIPLEDRPAVPKWLAPTYIWIGLNRWGTTGAASVLEKRVQELGGESREETVEDRALRLERAMKFETERKKFLNSARGVEAADKEFEALRAEFGRLINSIAGSIPLSLKSRLQRLVISGLGHALVLSWECPYSSTLDDSTLEISLWSDNPEISTFLTHKNPKILKKFTFKFDLLPTEQIAWASKDTVRPVYNTNDLASFMLKYYMDNGLKKKAVQ